MKRPLLTLAVWFCLGLMWQEINQERGICLIAVSTLVGLLVLTVLFPKMRLFFREWIHSTQWIFFLLPPAAFLLGLVCMEADGRQSALQNWMEQREVDSLQGELEGVVKKIVVQEEKANVWLSSVWVQTDGQMMESGGMVWYLDEAQWEQMEASLYPGQRIYISGTVRSFSQATNWGQFDLQDYYAAYGMEHAVSAENFQLEEKEGWVWQRAVQNVKNQLHDSILRSANQEDAGVFLAVFLGESKLMSEELRELYQKSGIAHILAVSGLHVSFFVLGLYQLLRKTSGSFLLAGIGGTAAAVLYAYLIGNPVSALRAVIMVICQMGAGILGRKYDLLSAASLAAVLLLAAYPHQLYQCGFLFSFLAVYGIGLVLPWLQKWMKKSLGAGIVCGAAIPMVLLPVQAYFYYTWNVGGILLNLAALPMAVYLLFSAMMTAVCGLASVRLGAFFAGMGHWVLKIYEWGCLLLQKSPIQTLVLGQPSREQCLLYYIILAVANTCLTCWIRKLEYEQRHSLDSNNRNSSNHFVTILGGGRAIRTPRQKRLASMSRSAIVVGLFVGLVWLLFPIRDGKMKLYFLDVGQGDCIAWITPQGHTILIDGGSSSVSEVGKWRIVPFLLSQGVSEIDCIVMTHPDADHYNGLEEVLSEEEVSVRHFLMTRAALDGKDGRQMAELAEKQGVSIYYAEDGFSVSEGECEMRCLYPTEYQTYEDSNDSSIVLEIQYGDFRALLTGDLGSEQEQMLEVKPVWLLKAGHHGSKYSSGEAFLQKLCPSYTIISRGVNRYGHPAKETLQRLGAVGSEWYDTYETGAILVYSDGTRHEIETFLPKE